MLFSRFAEFPLGKSVPIAAIIAAAIFPLTTNATNATNAQADDTLSETWTSATTPRSASNRLDEADTDRNFRLRFRGGVWLAAPTGDVRFGGSGNRLISLENELDLNDPEVSFTGDITLDFTAGRFKGWQLWFDAFDTSQDATTTLTRTTTVNGTNVAAGTSVTSALSATSVGAHLGYDLFGNLLDVNNADPTAADLRVHILGGIRLLNLEQSFRAPGAGIAIDYQNTHLIGELGGRLSILLEPAESSWGALDISVNMLSGYGFSDGSLTTVDLFTAISWYPVESASLTAGYRLFNITLDDVKQANGNNFEWDAYFAGFFLGGQVRF